MILGEVEREEIRALILETVAPMLEQQLLNLVEVSASVIQEKTVTKALIKKFYDENKDFEQHRDIAAAFLEKSQGDHPGVPFETIMEKATPEIRRHIDTIGSMDMTKGVKPDKPKFTGDVGTL